ncbi:MAG: PqqD family protein [Desulfurococcales archaeon ex4484_42]|nr:MAG: PqqD family protein [Desulfurococcales archaeon ex4484_42]
MAYEKIMDKKPQRVGTELGRDESQNYIIAIDEEKIYSISFVAYYVWTLCDGSQTVRELVDRISKELNAPVDELKEPVSLILEKLSEVGLVKFV